MATTVGVIEYDVRLNLNQLKKDTAQAEKLVKNSYDKVSKTKVSGTGAAKGASTQAEAITQTVQAQVNATKKAAQESYNAIAQYTPQIQRQFLTVERANNQVQNATVRSTSAIQNYGQGSTQAQRATSSLSVAVQNQAQQQSKLNSMLDGSYKSTNTWRNSIENSVGSLAALGGSIAILYSISSVLRSSVKAANQYEASLAGLDSVSQAFNQSVDKSRQAAVQLSADGLIPLAQSTQAFKNALATGYSIEEATQLLSGLKEQAVFNRQSQYDLGSAVVATTEGIKNGNSVLADATGTTTNLAQMAKQAGVNLQNLGDSSEMTAYRQAILNGFLKETSRSLGDVETYSNTAAGATLRYQTQLNYLQVTIGRVVNSLTKGLISSIATFIQQNQTAIIAVGTLVFVLGGTIASFVLAAKAVTLFGTALTFVSRHPIIATLSIILGLLGSIIAIGKINELSGIGDAIGDVDPKGMQDTASATGDAAKKAADLAKQLKKIDEQMSDVRRSFREQLAQLVQDKNENIAQLREQLASEKKQYQNAYSERLIDYQKTQNEEEKTHEQKTRELQNQIDFLRRYDSAANRSKLSELQFSLARENAEYTKSTELRKAEFDTETQAQLEEYQKRQAESQKQLNADLALLQKHREDIRGVRGVMLLDEIDSLKRSRDEQLKNLRQQRIDAVTASKETGAGAGAAFGSAYKNQIQSYLDKMKASTAASLGDKNWIKQMQNNFQRNWEKNGGDFWKPLKDSFKDLISLINGNAKVVKGKIVYGGKSGGWATGGYTGKGGINEPAGIVHRGEYVLPQSAVNQQTGMPDWEKIMSGSNSGTQVTVNLSLSGVMTSSRADERAVAVRIGKMIDEALVAKTGKGVIGV